MTGGGVGEIEPVRLACNIDADGEDRLADKCCRNLTQALAELDGLPIRALNIHADVSGLVGNDRHGGDARDVGAQIVGVIADLADGSATQRLDSQPGEGRADLDAERLDLLAELNELVGDSAKQLVGPGRAIRGRHGYRCVRGRCLRHGRKHGGRRGGGGSSCRYLDGRDCGPSRRRAFGGDHRRLGPATADLLEQIKPGEYPRLDGELPALIRRDGLLAQLKSFLAGSVHESQQAFHLLEGIPVLGQLEGSYLALRLQVFQLFPHFGLRAQRELRCGADEDAPATGSATAVSKALMKPPI